MSFQKQVYPSARTRHKEFCETYREPFTSDSLIWIDQIVALVDAGQDFPSAPITALLEDVLEQGSAAPDRWQLTREKLRGAGLIEHMRALLTILKDRKPPWEMNVATHDFRGLSGSVSLSLEAVFLVDRVKKTVIFSAFEVYSIC